MITEYEITKAMRFRPRGFEHISFKNEEFTRAFLNCLDDSVPVTLISGLAGSGKSEIYKMVAEILRDDALCLATTGRAATNLETRHVVPRTVHSGMHIPMMPFIDDSRLFKKCVDSLYNKTAVLIDEASMLSSNTLDTIIRHINYVSSQRKRRIKLILTYDMEQLPAVFDAEKLKLVIKDIPDLKNRWPFLESKELARLRCESFDLTEVHRQSDPVYKDVLSRCRTGNVTEHDLKYINSHIGSPKPGALLVASTNEEVNTLNKLYLDSLRKEGEPYDFEAEVLIPGRIKDSGFTEHVELFSGERVIVTRNVYDKESDRLLAPNGLCGNVAYFEMTDFGLRPVICTDDGREILIPKLQFDEIELEKDEDGRYREVVVASAMQIPLRAMRALTVHRVQGMSVDSLHVYPPKYVTPHLMYVALSRIRNPENLTLEGPVTKTMFSTHETPNIGHTPMTR